MGRNHEHDLWPLNYPTWPLHTGRNQRTRRGSGGRGRTQLIADRKKQNACMYPQNADATATSPLGVVAYKGCAGLPCPQRRGDLESVGQAWLSRVVLTHRHDPRGASKHAYRNFLRRGVGPACRMRLAEHPNKAPASCHSFQAPRLLSLAHPISEQQPFLAIVLWHNLSPCLPQPPPLYSGSPFELEPRPTTGDFLGHGRTHTLKSLTSNHHRLFRKNTKHCCCDEELGLPM